MIVAFGVGEPGSVGYLHRLREVGVLDRDEVLAWLRLHGAVLTACGAPLDAGEDIPEELLERLREELGG